MIERREREGERKRKKGRRRDIERDGEIRERERERDVKGIERVKGAQSKILVKSPKPRNKVQRKVDYKNYVQ